MADNNFLLIVAGMHRSGTSLCSSVIHKLGIDMVVENDAGAPSNERGHWERCDIVAVHDKILSFFAQAWHSLASLPAAWWRDPRLQDLKDALFAVAAGLTGKGAWGLKDPRIARLLPLWRELADRLGLPLKLVLCVRDPQAVAASLASRNDFSLDYGKLLWVRHYSDFFLYNTAPQWLVIDYDAWFLGGTGNIRKLVRFLGLGHAHTPSQLEAIQDATIAPGLRHNLAPVEHDYCHALYEKIRASGCDPEANAAVTDLFSAFARLNGYYAAIYEKSKNHDALESRLQVMTEREAKGARTVAELGKSLAVLDANCKTALADREHGRVLFAREQKRAADLAVQVAAARDEARQQADARRDLEAALDRETQNALALGARLQAAQAAVAEQTAALQAARIEIRHQSDVIQALDADHARDVQGLEAQENRLWAARTSLDALRSERRHLQEALADLGARLKYRKLDGLRFDEGRYRAHNPDVDAAIAAKKFASGLEHWLHYGFREEREPFFLD